MVQSKIDRESMALDHEKGPGKVMNEQWGVWSFGHTGMASDLLRRTERLPVSGAVETGSYTTGGLTFFSRTVRTGFDMKPAPPIHSPEGHVLTWDGRLDNREELRRSLQDPVSAEVSSGELVMAVWRQYGFPETFRRLIGDWALSLWDPRARRLYLARDFAGVRPLYYQCGPSGCWWSSSLEILLPLAKSPRALDRRYLAGMFFMGPDPSATPYEGIASVPPAHAVIIEEGRMHWQPFWTPPSGSRIRYRHDADYEEEFRTLVREAVRCRLRTERPAWAFLSGGLDSSSIVCIADDLIAAGDVSAPVLHTITYVFDPSPTTGERCFTAAVEQRRGQASHYLDARDYPYLRPRPAEGPPVPYLLDGSVALVQAQREWMGESNEGVLLCGSGGDELLGNSRRGELILADYLRHGELRTFMRGLRDWSVALRHPALRLFGQALASVWPRRARPFRGGRPPWLDSRFADLAGEPESVARALAHRQWPTGLWSVVARTAQQDYRSWCGSNVAYPFLDRRLVEFCLSIPLDQLTRPGQTRSLMRRSLRGIVPEKILARRSKTLPARPIGAAVEREWERLNQLFSLPLVEQYELAYGNGFKEALRRARHGTENFLGSLLVTIVLEEWLRQATERRWLHSAV